MSGAYYNENDAEKAAWLRELINRGAVAPGEVDERSITEVRADDLRGFEQCHFFAGIAVWSYSLRLAGWGDDEPVWTGSCPCPSFSAAGKGEGFDDARHLWPTWWRLIRESRPAVVLGEQVAAAVRYGWWDLVSTDLESEGYAAAAAVLTSAGVGAPDIRQRLYWVAYSDRCDGRGQHGQRSENRVEAGWMADTAGPRFEGTEDTGAAGSGRAQSGEPQRESAAGGVADAERDDGRTDLALRRQKGRAADGRDGKTVRLADADQVRRQDDPQVTGGFDQIFSAVEFPSAAGGSGEPCGMADAVRHGHDGAQGAAPVAHRDEPPDGIPERDGSARGMADAAPRGRGMLRSAPRYAGLAESGDRACGMGNAGGAGLPPSGAQDPRGEGGREEGREPVRPGAARTRGMADPGCRRPQEPSDTGQHGARDQAEQPAGSGSSCGMADPAVDLGEADRHTGEDGGEGGEPGLEPRDGCGIFIEHFAADALNGPWRTADWLFCTDGRWRPVEAGTFPLAHGTPLRLGRLRGYGDSINAEVAKAFIEACREAMTE